MKKIIPFLFVIGLFACGGSDPEPTDPFVGSWKYSDTEFVIQLKIETNPSGYKVTNTSLSYKGSAKQSGKEYLTPKDASGSVNDIFIQNNEGYMLQFTELSIANGKISAKKFTYLTPDVNAPVVKDGVLLDKN
jgi:P pilus assembly chaperone PapD